MGALVWGNALGFAPDEAYQGGLGMMTFPLLICKAHKGPASTATMGG